MGKRPRIEAGAWVAPSADVIGDVALGRRASVWYQSVVRGDVARVSIGERSNIQDHCTIHVTREGGPTSIGDDVTLGHGVTAHGCTVGDGALIGIGTVLLDNAVVEAGALVAAMSLVTAGTVIPAGMMAMGRPAKAVRELRDEEREWMAETVSDYMLLAREHAGRPWTRPQGS